MQAASTDSPPISSTSTSYESQLLIVTGYSGAGKSTVLRALEDIGFFCVDNLPISLLQSFFQLTSGPNSLSQNIALGLDSRAGYSATDLIGLLEQCNRLRYSRARIFFLTASDAILVKRFQETRRKHPLASTLHVVDAITQEKKLLQPLVEFADVLLDTDQLNIHQLRSFVRELFTSQEHSKLLITLISFGFKYGVPTESNFIFDVRSLPNPYFVPELKLLDGTSQEIESYLFSQPSVIEYWEKMFDFFQFSIQKALQEGRSFVSFAIGCTGGRHRSVAFIHKLAKAQMAQAQCLVKHRDIGQKE